MLDFTPKIIISDRPYFMAARISNTYLPRATSTLLLILLSSLQLLAQTNSSIPYRSQEVSERDGIPVLIKHLPDWENLRDRTTFAHEVTALKAALGDRSTLDLIDFSAGTEAVTAPYAAGKLLIIEYATPQASVDADGKFIARLADTGDTTTIYRRIGNYNAFVFDGSDPAAAEALLDQVKFEKNVQWLGDDPFLLHRAERAFVVTTADIFLSTLLVIVLGICVSILTGLIVGFVFFQMRERRRAGFNEFTDAGGMTRLNLDGFTPEIGTDRVLGE